MAQSSTTSGQLRCSLLGSSEMARPKLAVWKLASCDGCQLTLLDCQDELLALAAEVDIAHFTEATSADRPGPYDVSLVEGSVTTAQDAEGILRIREQSAVLVTIGACASAGGIQALRNFADVAEFTAAVYARPDYIATLATSTPVADHVKVDFELRGCPIDKRQLIELISALLVGRKPQLSGHSVCYECKSRGNTCVMVAHGTPCLGPVTQAGCGPAPETATAQAQACAKSSRMAAVTASTASAIAGVRPTPKPNSTASIACTTRRWGIRSTACARPIAAPRPRPCELTARTCSASFSAWSTPIRCVSPAVAAAPWTASTTTASDAPVHASISLAG